MKINKNQTGLIDAAIWVCIYGGLLSVVGGLAVAGADEELAYWLGGAGGLVAFAGCVLVFIRSKM